MPGACIACDCHHDSTCLSCGCDCTPTMPGTCPCCGATDNR